MPLEVLLVRSRQNVAAVLVPAYKDDKPLHNIYSTGKPLAAAVGSGFMMSSGEALSEVNFTVSSRRSVWMTAGPNDTSG